MKARRSLGRRFQAAAAAALAVGAWIVGRPGRARAGANERDAAPAPLELPTLAPAGTALPAAPLVPSPSAGTAVSPSAVVLPPVFRRTTSPNPYEAVARLKPGDGIRYRDRGGRRVTAYFNAFSPETERVSFTDAQGKVEEQSFEAFLSRIFEGSLRFIPGKDGAVNLDVPARSFAGFRKFAAESEAKDGVKVIFIAPNPDLAGRADRSGADYQNDHISLHEDATVGAFLEERAVAKRLGPLRRRLSERKQGLDGLVRDDALLPAAARGMRRALNDLLTSWDKLCYAERGGYVGLRDQMLAEMTTAIFGSTLPPPPGAFKSRPMKMPEPIRQELARWLEEAAWTLSRVGSKSLHEKPEAPLPPGAASAAAWKWYAERFQATALENVNRNLGHYLRAKAEGDRHVAVLEELDFRFEPVVKVPPLESLLARYNARLDALIAAGTVRAEEVLRPARAFKGLTGRILHVPFGEPIPEEAVPVDDTLSNGDFGDMVAAGYFPMGPHLNLLQAKPLTVFEHDLGHLTAFLEHPRFMAAVRRTYARVRRDGLPEELRRQARRNTNRFDSRMYDILELFAAVPAAKRGRLLAALGLPRAWNGRIGPMVGEVRSFLNDLDSEELKGLLEALRREYPALLERFGGTVNDVIGRATLQENPGSTGFEKSLDRQWRHVTRPWDADVPLARLGGYHDARVEELAVFIKRLLQSTRIDPAKLVVEARRPVASLDSSLQLWLSIIGREGD